MGVFTEVDPNTVLFAVEPHSEDQDDTVKYIDNVILNDEMQHQNNLEAVKNEKYLQDPMTPVTVVYDTSADKHRSVEDGENNIRAL
jgi:hypothetical protein